MGRRRREQAELQVLARRVWGDDYYERHVASKPRRRRRGRGSRLQAVVGIGVGVPMLLTAGLLSLFTTAASAHVSAIDISCTGVRFGYDDFPSGTNAVSHEVVSIDGVEVAERDFPFVGPSASDTISISVGFGTHLVEASDSWTFDGRPQGSASDHQQLSYCSPSSTTTASYATSTTSPHHQTSTSSSAPRTTSTSAPHQTTTSAPETTTSVPTTVTTASGSTTTTVRVTTTTTGQGSTTTTGPGTTSTTSPVHNLGSTTTTRPVQPNGSTVPPGATSTASPPGSNLPFTGSGRDSLVGGLFAIGVGLLALGLTSVRKGRARSGE